MKIENGEVVYSERLDQSVWATPFGIGDKMYFIGEVGTSLVLRAGPKFEKLATNVLWEDDADVQYAPPPRPSRGEGNAADAAKPSIQTEIPKTKPRQYAAVYVGNKLLIRRGDQLYAIANPK